MSERAMAEAQARPPALSLRNITKSFGAVRALVEVSVDFAAAEVHAVLGENGAGKSTLMKIVYGLLRPDGGTIALEGEQVQFASPLAARAAGIGMVHQELDLVDALSVTENLALSLGRQGWRFEPHAVAAEAAGLAERIGLEIGDPRARVGELPIGVRQRIEILKALAGRARVLILDEPTAVLTPAETRQLFAVLDRLRAQGTAIVFITHKLPEAMEIADRVTVMRRGRVVATRSRGELSESHLAELMVGEVPSPRARAARTRSSTRLALRAVTISDTSGAPSVSLEIASGEILGVAGVDGNGQKELFETVVGLRCPGTGSVEVDGRPVPRPDPALMIDLGVGCVPPDRRREGLVLEMSIAENLVLHRRLLRRIAGRWLLRPLSVRRFAEELAARHDIRTADVGSPAASLSGGNQQRTIIARVLAAEPRVLVAVNPTRGLDIAATQAVYERIESAAQGGTAVLLISTDLDEVLDLSDRVAVLFRGALSDPISPPFAAEQLGLMMAGGDVRRCAAAGLGA